MELVKISAMIQQMKNPDKVQHLKMQALSRYDVMVVPRNGQSKVRPYKSLRQDQMPMLQATI